MSQVFYDNQKPVYRNTAGTTSVTLDNENNQIIITDTTASKTILIDSQQFSNGVQTLPYVQMYENINAVEACVFPAVSSSILAVNNEVRVQDLSGNVGRFRTNGSDTEILSSGNLILDPSLNLVIGSGSSLTLQPTNNISTTLVPYGLDINSPSTKTYPTTANFNAYPLYKLTAELGTNQTYDTSTGFNFIYGDSRVYTKSAGTTSDIERLFFTGFAQSFGWTDANTCKQYTGITDDFTYSGINANSRTSSSFRADAITLNCPTSSTQTITTIRANRDFRINANANNANATYTITNSTSPNLSLFGSGANVIANITNHSFFENNSFWDVNWTGAGSMATITNMFGLRLNPPSGGTTTGLTITNNWGVYSGWSSAKNYFAGGVGIGTTSISNALDVSGNATISTSLNCPLIKNTGGTIEINGLQINLDATTIDLQNTSTTTSTATHNADIKATSNGLESTTFLKVKLNGNDIWIPYFTTDPSL